jgi:hypothetical protein
MFVPLIRRQSYSLTSAWDFCIPRRDMRWLFLFIPIVPGRASQALASRPAQRDKAREFSRSARWSERFGAIRRTVSPVVVDDTSTD